MLRCREGGKDVCMGTSRDWVVALGYMHCRVYNTVDTNLG